MTRYQKLVAEAKRDIKEVTPEETVRRGDALILDVREADEWEEGHVPRGKHLSRGLLESEIENIAPDPATPIICHCGGGGRSALAVQSLRKMGYTNVYSMAGGFKAWRAAGLPVER